MCGHIPRFVKKRTTHFPLLPTCVTTRKGLGGQSPLGRAMWGNPPWWRHRPARQEPGTLPTQRSLSSYNSDVTHAIRKGQLSNSGEHAWSVGQWSRIVIVLAIGPNVPRVQTWPRAMGLLRARKIRKMTSFGIKVKPTAPCHKILRQVSPRFATSCLSCKKKKSRELC
jgi:hypothetical protein